MLSNTVPLMPIVMPLADTWHLAGVSLSSVILMLSHFLANLCCSCAGEGEYVAFAEECSCDGPVESWLQNVVDAMRAALSHEFKVAIPAYDEKPRTKWIFDYSVQNTIMVSRTFFTQDVNEAFEELEEGNEDALKVSLTIVSKLQLALAS
jgi:hypothetical protein